MVVGGGGRDGGAARGGGHESLRGAGEIHGFEGIGQGFPVERATTGHLLEFLVFRHGLHAAFAVLPSIKERHFPVDVPDEVAEQRGVLRQMIRREGDADAGRVTREVGEPAEAVGRVSLIHILRFRTIERGKSLGQT